MLGFTVSKSCRAQLVRSILLSKSWAPTSYCAVLGHKHHPASRICCPFGSSTAAVNLYTPGSIHNAGRRHTHTAVAHDAAAQHAEHEPASPSPQPDVGPQLGGLHLSRAPYDTVTPFCVVNFYHLTVLSDPQQVVSQHRQYLQDKDVRGRVWVSEQGINAQYGGTRAEAVGYAEWVSQQQEFQGLRWSVWPADTHMFPKLRLKYKPNLISLAGGMAGLPVHDPASRATPLAPEDWKQMLREAKQARGAQGQEEGREAGAAAAAAPIVVLDVRNDYEWDAGHFEGAERPDEEEFSETPTVLSEQDVPTPLRGLPKDTKVMMYCTGGIRCDVYSTLLKRKGFHNLYTLEGGVQNYLRQQAGELWNGSLFVFDGRMALPARPAALQPLAQPSTSGAAEGSEQLGTDGPLAATPAGLPAAVPCQLCGSDNSQLPHLNCANIDCNELFIACPRCKTRWNGCCCSECMDAPRLVRPVSPEGGRFGAWGNYVDPDEWHPKIASGRSPEGRVARRARRRRAAQAKRAKMIEERTARKQLMRSVMAELAKKMEAAKLQEAAGGAGGAGAAGSAGPAQLASSAQAGEAAATPAGGQEQQQVAA